MTSALVYWNTQEGKKRLFESKYARAFYSLAHLFERQLKPTYCGVASAVMVLNALRAEKKGLKIERKFDVKIPATKGGGVITYNAYTQLTFLGPDTDKVKKRALVEGTAKKAFDPGLSLDDLAKKLRLHLCNVEVMHADKKSCDRFRKDLMAYMNDSSAYIITNFDSNPLGREGAGHFSLIAAYHPKTDSCFVMDVAGHKLPWFWVEVPALYKAMNTKDSGAWRGYLIVSDKL